MPAYDYGCPNCGVFEAKTSLEDRDNVLCGCGRPAKRLSHYERVQFGPARETTRRSLCPDYPINDEVRKTWDENGVRPVGDKYRWL